MSYSCLALLGSKVFCIQLASYFIFRGKFQGLTKLTPSRKVQDRVYGSPNLSLPAFELNAQMQGDNFRVEGTCSLLLRPIAS
jgi:hypothetical protein